MTHPIDVTTPGDREIRVARTFDAPRALVFTCHTTPELVRRWMLGPPGWTMPVCEIDLRVGGRYRYVWRSEADGSEFGFTGEYREIAAPDRIVHSERVDGTEGGEESEAHCTVTMTERDGRTTLVYTMRFASRDARDQVFQTGMADGMGASYDRLDAVLESAADDPQPMAASRTRASTLS